MEMSPGGSNPPSPRLPGTLALAQSSRAPACPELWSPILPEAADCSALGASRVTVMAAVRAAAAETKCSKRTSAAPKSLRAAPRRSTRPVRSSSARGRDPGGVRPGARAARGSPTSPPRKFRPAVPRCFPQPQPRPQARRPPRNPRTAQQVCARVPACVCLRAAAGVEGVRGVETPARHLPSSLSSTIISGAPCPAAARLGREKGADSGRVSAGRPVLGQLAGSNYPLVRLLT
uniref:Uncharacterized protein n=1 Tax=Nomascus leucogenys TaxID=61853 RepID=A0A2I3HVI9_NOMLE